jgi:hypothetical protein
MQESKRSALTVNASIHDKTEDEIEDETENQTEDQKKDGTKNGEHGVVVSHGSARVALVVVGC